MVKKQQKNKYSVFQTWTLRVPKIVDFANSLHPDEAVNNELPNLDLHCLPSSH